MPGLYLGHHGTKPSEKTIRSAVPTPSLAPRESSGKTEGVAGIAGVTGIVGVTLYYEEGFFG